jgi:hypothetical protein
MGRFTRWKPAGAGSAIQLTCRKVEEGADPAAEAAHPGVERVDARVVDDDVVVVELERAVERVRPGGAHRGREQQFGPWPAGARRLRRAACDHGSVVVVVVSGSVVVVVVVQV